MTSRRRFFFGFIPLSAGAATIPAPKVNSIEVRPYTGWGCCACGYCMLGLSSTGQPEMHMKCVNSNCRNFDIVVGVPTFKANHEPQD